GSSPAAWQATAAGSSEGPAVLRSWNLVSQAAMESCSSLAASSETPEQLSAAQVVSVTRAVQAASVSS
ncbi:MAG: hypothetical protein ACRYGI_09645, partial [Janthinobacterium lividum]